MSISKQKKSNPKTTSNNEKFLSLLDQKEYYENKLLSLKLKNYKNNYLDEKKSIKIHEEIDKLNIKNDELLSNIEEIDKKIENIKAKNEEKAQKLKDIDEELKIKKEKNEKLMNELKEITQYLQNINKTENIINHILTFPKEFTKKIYNICSERVNFALQYNQNIMMHPQYQGQQRMNNVNNTNGGNNNGQTQIPQGINMNIGMNNMGGINMNMGGINMMPNMPNYYQNMRPMIMMPVYAMSNNYQNQNANPNNQNNQNK